MAKTAKSFSEVEPISKTFKNQPVEIYVQQNDFYVGFNHVFFKGECLYNTFENKKFLCMDIVLTATSPLLERVPATEVVKMVVDGGQYSINDPEYVHKRYVWDSEDLELSNLGYVRVGDIVKLKDGFHLCVGTYNGDYKLLDLEDLTLSNLGWVYVHENAEIYQHKTLWERAVSVVSEVL